MVTNKLLLIIVGECFREGGQYSRLKDTDISVTNQLKATESHLSFIEYLKNKYGITTDIQLISYISKYENILINQYNKYNLQYKFYDKYFVDRTTLVNSTKIENIAKEYDSILVIRPDMYLKPFFLDIFDPYATKICYPSVCYVDRGKHRIQQYPRVNDTMVFIPKNYFDIAYYTIGIKLYHEAILDYVTHSQSINKPLHLHTDFDFFLKTPHDSDSSKDYNPIYYLISRPETKKWYSYGYEIREIDFLPIETNNILYNFPDWNFLDNNISHKQYNEIQNPDKLWEWWDISNGSKKFIDIIELDFENKMENLCRVTPTRCEHESYWLLKDDYKLYFYDKHKKITSILYKKNNLEFTGPSMISNHSFCLKKIPTIINKEFNIIKKNQNKIKRAALCIRGAISRKNRDSPMSGMIYNLNDSSYIDFEAVQRSINKHIIQCNPSITIDTFIHCWNEDLSSDLDKLYNPALSVYENNNIYQDEILMRCFDKDQFSIISQALTIKKVLQLTKTYEESNKFQYDTIILYRPDVLLWKNIILNNYNVSDSIYVNAHPDGGGDFHFIMSSCNAQKFKELYDYVLAYPIKNRQWPYHGWIKEFIINYMQVDLQIDDIIPGLHQEVARPHKLRQYSIEQHGIDPNIFLDYGIKQDYIFNY